jgi:hypothetical protein
MSLHAKNTLGMSLHAEIYFWAFPYTNRWQYNLAVPSKHIKGMAISFAMLLLADLQNLVFYKDMLLKAKLENFHF